jgi:hypothetical protein
MSDPDPLAEMLLSMWDSGATADEIARAAREFFIKEIEDDFNRFGNESWIPGVANAIAVVRGPV